MNVNSRKSLAFFALLFVLVYAGLHFAYQYSFVHLELESSRSTYLKIYWTEKDQDWSEDRTSSIRLNARKKHYLLPIHVDLSQLERLRIDPSDRKGVRINLKKLSVTHPESATLAFSSPGSLGQFQHNADVTDLEINQHGMLFTASGADPNLVVTVSPEQHRFGRMARTIQAVILALVLFYTLRLFPVLVKNFRFVPWAMLLVSVLIFAMATVTRNNAHPDEFAHINASTYYATHLSPPAVCSEETRHTYSIYGISRLDKREIAYYVAGRYAQLINFIPAPTYLKLRYFNVLMFVMLTIMAFRSNTFRLITLPLLLTPQAWYLFSYFNSDAFSLFATLLAAYQLFERKSMLRRLLRGELPARAKTWLWISALAILIAAQFFLKKNYFFFHIFIAMLGVAWLITRRKLPSLQNTMPLLIAFILGAGLFAGWQVWHKSVNDFKLADKIYECRETTANHWYKPSTPLEKTHPNFMWRAKGMTLEHMLTTKQWWTRLWQTGFGIYGYTEYTNAEIHYQIAGWLMLSLLGYVGLTILLRGDAMARLSVLAAIATTLGLIAAIAWHNWNQDFQPQGRYLAPFLPVLGLLLAIQKSSFNGRIVSLLSLVLYILGLFSFVYVGWIEIPK